jgi:hypothetical protein
VAELGDLPVDEGIEGRELGAGAGVHPRLPLAEGNGDVRETGRVDDGALDMVGSGLDVVEVEVHGGTPMTTASSQNAFLSLALPYERPAMMGDSIPRPSKYASILITIPSQTGATGWV